MMRYVQFLVIVWCVLRAILLGCAWFGDQNPARLEQVLKHFTTEDISKGREYVRNGFGVRFLYGYVQLALFWYLWRSGFLKKLEMYLESFLGGGFWISSIAVTLAMLVITTLAMLPFDFYLGFVCERRMNFTEMTALQWLWRHIKMCMAGWALETIGIVTALAVVKWCAYWWPLLLPIATTMYALAVTLLMPYVITPLFYEQKPLPEGPLRNRILEIAKKASVPVKDIYVIDESRYSKHTNAYFTGLFKEKRIVLYDTLVKSHPVDEAALIFAHEAGHWIHDHVRMGFVLSFLGSLCGALVLWRLYPILAADSSMCLAEIYKASNLPFFLVAMTVFGLLFSPIESQISQAFERQADWTSLELTGLTETFINAQKRLALNNRSELLPHPLRVFWLYSHPPTIDRIAMAERFSAAQHSSRQPRN